jgi:hypothetical protein
MAVCVRGVRRGRRWGRRQGRLGLAMARAAHGARGVGKEGGAALGGSHGMQTGGPRPASTCVYDGVVVGRRGVPARRRAHLRSRAKMFRTSPVQPRFSQDF